MLTKEQRVQNAIAHLKQIGCYKPYLKAYQEGVLTMYEGFGGYYVEDPEILEKIHDVEEDYGGTIYAVIHSLTNFGELYTFLWSTGYEENADYDVEDYGDNQYGCMAYVWNKTYEDCSEFETVVIKPALGGLIIVH